MRVNHSQEPFSSSGPTLGCKYDTFFEVTLDLSMGGCNWVSLEATSGYLLKIALSCAIEQHNADSAT